MSDLLKNNGLNGSNGLNGLNGLNGSNGLNGLNGLNYSDLLGKQFAYGGRVPAVYDCWGLCMEIYKRLGRQLPDGISTREYIDINQQINSKIRNPQSENFREISAPLPYCLVTIMIRPPYITHVGVVLDDRIRFIHIMHKCSVAVERLDNPSWSRRIKGFYHFCRDAKSCVSTDIGVGHE